MKTDRTNPSFLYPELHLPSIKKSNQIFLTPRTKSRALPQFRDIVAMIQDCKRFICSKSTKRDQMAHITSAFDKTITTQKEFQNIFHLKLSLIEIIILFGDYHLALSLISDFVFHFIREKMSSFPEHIQCCWTYIDTAEIV